MINNSSQKHKKVIYFEGLKATGKTSMIYGVKSILHSDYKVEILNKLHPWNSSILFEGNPNYIFENKKYAKSLFRWSRQFLYLNHIFKSKAELFLIDRGILTTYIHSKLDGIPDGLIDNYLMELKPLLDCFKIKTIILECELEETKNRIGTRKVLSPEQITVQKRQNEDFDNYYKNLDGCEFINELGKFRTDRKEDWNQNLNEIINFIEKN